jgi:hypothetical protein
MKEKGSDLGGGASKGSTFGLRGLVGWSALPAAAAAAAATVRTLLPERNKGWATETCK